MRGIAILFVPLALAACGRQAAEHTPADEAILAPDKTADSRCAAKVGFHQPPEGMIPSAAVAKRVGLAYLRAHYPELADDPSLTLKAELANGIWHVGLHIPPGSIGGGPNVEICRSNGLVLELYATQ